MWYILELSPKSTPYEKGGRSLKESFKKVISIVLSMTLVFSLSSVSAYAKSLDLSGYKYYKSYKCTSYMKGTMTSNANSVKFSGQTGGEYKGSTTPTAITHNDIIKSLGIGSISVSCNGSTSTGTATISGNTCTESYTAKNTNKITVYPTYKGASSLLTFWVTFSASTKYQFGSTYVVVATGDAGS